MNVALLPADAILGSKV